MAAPKKSKKISVKSDTAETDELSKKITESANAAVKKTKPAKKISVSGAPEISADDKTPPSQAEPINVRNSSETAAAISTAPELENVSPREKNIQPPEPKPTQEEPSKSDSLEQNDLSDDAVFDESDETARLIEELAPDEDTPDELAVEANASEAAPDVSGLETASSTAAVSGEVVESEETALEEQGLDKSKSIGELSAETTDPDNEFADAETAAVVDDIVASEADEILEREDRIREELALSHPAPAKAKRRRFGEAFQNPAVKWGLLTGLFLLLTAAIFLPASRYAALNTAGIRVKSSLTVQDSMTKLPLKNVKVSIQDKTAVTDNEGRVELDKLKLGKSQLKIEKRGFATVDRTIVLGWGSNPLAPQGIEAVGSVYVFDLKDFLSDKPITNAEASSGDSSAKSNNQGQIRLVVDKYDGDVTVNIKADGLREEALTFGAQDKSSRIVKMVSNKPDIFISKRSGKYDVYKIDIDGKNEKNLLTATGKERDDIHLLAHPIENIAALVSTREGKKNRAGYVLSGLYIIEPDNESPLKIDESERVRIIDWSDKWLIYQTVVEGESAANPERSKLKSYNFDTGETKQLAKANYFNDSALFDGSIYYAPSAYAVNVDEVKFYRIKPDGSDQQVVLDKEVWNIIRSSYDVLSFTANQSWYEVSGSSAKILASPPTVQRTRVYRDSASKKASLWIDERDGKGVLVLRMDDGAEKVLQSSAGLTQPVRWLNDSTIIYRVVNSQETADYALNVDSGNTKKIVDVTNTGTAESYRN